MIKSLTLDGLQKHFWGLYGRRTLVVDKSLANQILLYQRQIARIDDAIRKHQPLGPPLASGFSYLMNLTNYFRHEISIAHGMMRKFPPGKCAYCQKQPCECRRDQRPEPIEGQWNELQASWFLRQWQRDQFETYGVKHEGGNIYELSSRLVSEAGEVTSLAIRGPKTPNIVSEVISENELELADNLSWLLALANRTQVDLMDEVVALYTTCPRCHTYPCSCPIIMMSADGNSISSSGGKRCTTIAE